MILTVTMNPSVDTRYQLDRLAIDDVNRVTPVKTAGGKGLNVARVLSQLGDDVLATGLIGGNMGAYFAELMDEDGINHEFVTIAGETRICLNILHEGNQTELLESGPEVKPAELERFVRLFTTLIKRVDCITMSGSLPRGVDASCYARLVSIAVGAGVPVLLDTSGAPLAQALASDIKPTLIKPNISEVGALLGDEFSADDIERLRGAIAADARLSGIPWIVVTMGSAGAIALHEGVCYRVVTTPIEAVNATGSGDATIAGFAHALVAGADDEELLRTGNTCGKLNAMDPRTGNIDLANWYKVYSSVSVDRI